MDELEGVVSRLKIDSAPGPDNIFSKLLINADKTVLDFLLQIFYQKLERRILRERPFNLKGGGGGYGFLLRSEFFFRTSQELEYLFLLSRKVRNSFPELNIRLYDKNS